MTVVVVVQSTGFFLLGDTSDKTKTNWNLEKIQHYVILLDGDSWFAVTVVTNKPVMGATTTKFDEEYSKSSWISSLQF